MRVPAAHCPGERSHSVSAISSCFDCLRVSNMSPISQSLRPQHPTQARRREAGGRGGRAYDQRASMERPHIGARPGSSPRWTLLIIFERRRLAAADCELKVSRAFTATMPHSRALRLLVLKSGLALRACALGLRVSPSPSQFDVADCSVRAKMPGDREVINSANGG